MIKFAILARQRGNSVELKDFGEVDSMHLTLLAETAADEGYEIMYECNARPAMGVVAAVARRGGRVVGLPFVERLWDLRRKDV